MLSDALAGGLFTLVLAGLIAVQAVLYGASLLRNWNRPARPPWRWTLAAPFCAAHRGGAGLAPENTLAAFTEAVSRHGCSFLELDVHATADGVPVVIHDPTVNRTTEGRGVVAGMTLEQVRALDAGHRFRPAPDAPGARATPAARTPVPTLEEVLRGCPQAWFSIDVKQAYPPCEDAVVQVIRRTRSAARVLLGCESDRQFRRLQSAGPEIPSFFTRRAVVAFRVAVWLGVARWARPLHHTLQVPERVGPLRIVTRRFVQAAHALGLPVIVWTVNEPADMRRLLALGVDGLITDRPDRFNAVVRELAAAQGTPA